MACLMYPELAKTNAISEDAKNRFNLMNKQMRVNVGAYTEVKGYKYVREQIARYINERDGDKVNADIENIYTCNGASEGVK